MAAQGPMGGTFGIGGGVVLVGEGDDLGHVGKFRYPRHLGQVTRLRPHSGW